MRDGAGYARGLPTTARNLCFHYVTERPSERRLGIDVESLRRVLTRELARRRPARLSEYLERPPGPDRFTVSFDDAHASVLTLAAPLLRELGIPATLFVPSAWVGTSPEWLDEAGLRALLAFDFELGAHTIHHPRMGVRLFGEDEAAHAARLGEEARGSRARLERWIGRDVALFAYPYGEDPKLAREAVLAAGLRAGFTIRDARDIDGEPEWDGDRASIPRMDGLEATGLVAPRSEQPLPISVVVPVRDRPRMIREVVRRWTEQSYPEDRYEVIVVDDGSARPLEGAFDDPRVRVLRVSSPSEPFRAGRARNLGVEAARFPLVQLADSDVVVPRDFLWAVDWAHQRTGGSGVGRAVLLGALSGYNLRDLGQRHRLADVEREADLSRLPWIPDRQREPVVRAVIDNVDWLEDVFRLAYTGNVSFPRELFEEVGGFATEFSGWGLEDLDLGLRMERAGASFLYSRFAMGYHLEDEDEPAPRNPFRRARATRDDFAGYLANLERLRRLHPSDASVTRFCARTEADVDEITGRPSTVGVEFGGALASDGPSSPLHHAIHRVTPGGVHGDELLERVAYAERVGARRLWLQGGDVARDPRLARVLEAAHAAKLRVGLQARPLGLADASLARRLAALGVDHVTLLVDPAHDALDPRHEGAYEASLAALRAAGIHAGARVVAASLEDARRGIERARSLGLDALRVAVPSSLRGAIGSLAEGAHVEALEP